MRIEWLASDTARGLNCDENQKLPWEQIWPSLGVSPGSDGIDDGPLQSGGQILVSSISEDIW